MSWPSSAVISGGSIDMLGDFGGGTTGGGRTQVATGSSEAGMGALAGETEQRRSAQRVSRRNG